MKKEETQEFEQLSLLCFGKKYAYKKLLTRGLIHDVKQVGSGHTARRRVLTKEGCKAYMEQTLAMREQIKKELEEQKDESGR